MVSPAAFDARVWGSVPGFGSLKETKMFLPHPRVKVSIVGSLRDREVACSGSDRQGPNFESSVWRTVSSQSSHHPQEVLQAQFSLYVHKGGLKPDSFYFISFYFRLKDSLTVNLATHVCSKDLSGRLKWKMQCTACTLILVESSFSVEEYLTLQPPVPHIFGFLFFISILCTICWT